MISKEPHNNIYPKALYIKIFIINKIFLKNIKKLNNIKKLKRYKKIGI